MARATAAAASAPSTTSAVIGSLSGSPLVLGTATQIDTGWTLARNCGASTAVDVRTKDVARCGQQELFDAFRTIAARPVETLADGTIRCIVESAQQRDVIDRTLRSWILSRALNSVVEVSMIPVFTSSLMALDATRGGQVAQAPRGGWFAAPAGDWRVSSETDASGQVVRLVLDRVL